MSDLIIPEPEPDPIGPDVLNAPQSPAEALIEDPTPEPEPDMFPRTYVEELRREAAGHRTRAKAYEDAFDGMDDDTREAWLEYTALVVKAQKGDESAIERIQELFGGDDDDFEDEDPPIAADSPPDYELLARQAAEAVYMEKEQARLQSEQIQAVRTAGESFGYKFGTEDYILFVRGANEAANAGDEDPLAAGDRAVKAYRQAIVDAYLGSKAQQADSTTAIPDGGGAAPNLSKQPFDPASPSKQQWADVRESALQRIQGARG